MPKLILFSGKARAGKDLGAKYLSEALEKANHKTCILHYADVLKFVASQYYGYDGDKTKPEMRTLLQNLGTKVFRKHNPGCWWRIVKEIVLGMGDTVDYVLIPDCRFVDEVTWQDECGLENLLIRVERPNFDNGLTEEQKRHASETELDNYPMDLYLINDHGMWEYQLTIEAMAPQLERLFALKKNKRRGAQDA